MDLNDKLDTTIKVSYNGKEIEHKVRDGNLADQFQSIKERLGVMTFGDFVQKSLNKAINEGKVDKALKRNFGVERT